MKLNLRGKISCFVVARFHELRSVRDWCVLSVVLVMDEITTKAGVDIRKIMRDTVRGRQCQGEILD